MPKDLDGVEWECFEDMVPPKPQCIIPLCPKDAKDLFLYRYETLKNKPIVQYNMKTEVSKFNQ